jgi:endoglucanase
VSLLALVVGLLAGCSGEDPADPASTTGTASIGVTAPPVADPVPLDPVGNPFAGRFLYTLPDSPAASAAADAASGTDQEILRRIAEQPTAIWLTPEQHPMGTVGTYASRIVAQAAARRETPVFVIYGIPQRDCLGEESAGGLDDAVYLQWVTEAATAIGTGGVVILEPDALASAVACQLADDRVAQLAAAVDTLVARQVVTYIDAGHSNWIAPQEMADLLTRVGVSRVRGIAVNVSAYQLLDDERAYAEELRSLTGLRGYVIDTGRNGVGPLGDEWCNPPGRALGETPFAGDDGGLDARLWVKPPGESDGTCHGGPSAGTYWPERAVELARAAGW